MFSASVLAAAAGGLTFAGSAGGFGTVNRFGQHAEHERITRAALACASPTSPANCFEATTITNLAGGPGTFGAVGAPDSDEVIIAAAHCDNADFLTGRYPRTRAAATVDLLNCRAHLKWRFNQAVAAAGRLLDSSGHIIPREVDLSRPCTFFGGASGRAKCDVLEGFGRALHGAQDFYSHSNWADEADSARPTGVKNPPGLASTAVAPVMDLRAATVTVPTPLSTGCFSLIVIECRGRVTHGVLNKDKGIIDPVTAAASSPTTPRGRVGTNFARAVRGAIDETRRQWADLADEIVRTYGSAKGNLMICAIAKDNPLRDCTGRMIVIAVDSSGSNQETDPGNLRIAAARAFNDALISEAEAKPGERPDQSASIDFDSSARLISPLGDPSRTRFDGIDSSGGTDIGSGVSLAIQELTKDPNVDPRDRSGIIVLTDGLDGGSSLPGALAEAKARGIRVSFGFLSPPPNPVPTPTASSARAAQAQTRQRLPDYVDEILETGGSYAVIDSAEAQRSFVDLALKNGITNLDDPKGSAQGGPLETGIASAGVASATPAVWSYTLRPGGVAEITLQAAAGSTLSAVVRDVRSSEPLGTVQLGPDGAGTLRVRPLSGEIEIAVSSDGASVPYTIRADVRDVLVSGTPGADTLTCGGAEAGYADAGDGNDRVTCGPSADTLVGGRGADRLSGGDGDDLFIVRAADVRRGTERIDGGNGNDTALFLFERPRGVTCKSRRVPVGRSRVVLTGVERLLFDYRPCNAPRIPRPQVAGLGARGARPSLVPPRPSVRATATRWALRVRVRVRSATAILVTANARGTALKPAVRTAPRRGTYRFRITLPPPARRASTATVRVTTIGTVDGPTKRKTVRVRLRTR